MNNIKTIADFKRAMIPGTFWECTHKYIGKNPSKPKSLGLRECVLNNSVDFGFKTEKGISSARNEKALTYHDRTAPGERA